MTGRPLLPLELSPEEEEALQTLARRRTTAQARRGRGAGAPLLPESRDLGVRFQRLASQRQWLSGSGGSFVPA
jgi:hypothetical protein